MDIRGIAVVLRKSLVFRAVLALLVLVSVALSVEIGFASPVLMARLSKDRAATERLMAAHADCAAKNPYKDERPSKDEAFKTAMGRTECILAAAQGGGVNWLWWELALASAPHGHDWPGRRAFAESVFSKGAQAARDEVSFAKALESGLPVSSFLVSAAGERMPFLVMAQNQGSLFLRSAWSFASPSRFSGFVSRGPEGMVEMEQGASLWAASEEASKALANGEFGMVDGAGS